jgi:hypothetical protein
VWAQSGCLVPLCNAAASQVATQHPTGAFATLGFDAAGQQTMPHPADHRRKLILPAKGSYPLIPLTTIPWTSDRWLKK